MFLGILPPSCSVFWKSLRRIGMIGMNSSMFIWCVHTCLVVSDLLWPPLTVCSLPGSFVRLISQTRILEWVAISSSKWPFQPRNWTHVSCISCIGGRFFTIVPTGKPHLVHLIGFACDPSGSGLLFLGSFFFYYYYKFYFTSSDWSLQNICFLFKKHQKFSM